MNRDSKLLIGIAINAVLAVAILAVLVLQAGKGAEQKSGAADPLPAASALMARGLYAAALDEFDHYRRTAGLTAEAEADLCFRMGKIADDDLKDCGRALPYYTLAEALDPQADWAKDAGKRSVACMDKLGKARESQALLDQITGGPSSPAPAAAASGPTVATVDGKSVTWDEVEATMGPAPVTGGTADLEARKRMVREYLSERLVYEDAIKKGYERDEAAVKFLKRAEREALVRYHLLRSLGDVKDQEAIKRYMETIAQSRELRIFDDAIPPP